MEPARCRSEDGRLMERSVFEAVHQRSATFDQGDSTEAALRRHVSVSAGVRSSPVLCIKRRGNSVSQENRSPSPKASLGSSVINYPERVNLARRSSRSLDLGQAMLVAETELHYEDSLLDNSDQEKFAKAVAAVVLAASDSRPRNAITEVPIHLYQHGSEQTLQINHAGRSLLGINATADSKVRFGGPLRASSFCVAGSESQKDCMSSSRCSSRNSLAMHGTGVAVGAQVPPVRCQARRSNTGSFSPDNNSTSFDNHTLVGTNRILATLSNGNSASIPKRAGRFLSRAASWRHNRSLQRIAASFNFGPESAPFNKLKQGTSLDIENGLDNGSHSDTEEFGMLLTKPNEDQEEGNRDSSTQTNWLRRGIWTAPAGPGRRDCKVQSDEDFFREMYRDGLLDEEERRKIIQRLGLDERGVGCSDTLDETDGADAEANENRTSASAYLKEQFLSFFQPSDNKLAMKLFGNKNALNREKRRLRQQGKWIIHPCSSFRFYWDLIMLILLIANLIILPITISFMSDDNNSANKHFNIFSDTIFLLDIVVNFRTGIILNDYVDEILLEPIQIAHHYLRSWFVLDLISSLPIDHLVRSLVDKGEFEAMQSTRALRMIRLVKLISLLRLLRLSRLVRYVSQWEEFLNVASKFIGILNLVLLMLLLGHWNACLQFLIPMLQSHPEHSWTAKCGIKDSPLLTQYTWALFKAMSHMLSIGYGRFPPTNIDEAWITIISMMTGATCYALFVGHAAALIQSFDCSKRMYREKFKQVEEYMAYRKLPRSLRQRIANYYEHRYQGKMFNELSILDELSECLREQIINYNCRALVAAVPFFTYADQEFVSEVVVKLRYEVFQPGDLVIKEGTIGSKMYFIQEGIVDIINKDGEVATSLSDGSYFGEICLLTNARRVASVRAETYCNVYSLDRLSFLEVLDKYPLMRRTLESVAAERLNKLGEDPLLVSNRKDLCDDLQLVKEIVDEVSHGYNATPFSSGSDTAKTHGSSSSDSDSGPRSSFTRHLRKKRWRPRGHSAAERSGDPLHEERSKSINNIVTQSIDSRRRSMAQLVQKMGLKRLRHSASNIGDHALKLSMGQSSRPRVIVTPANSEGRPVQRNAEMYEILEEEGGTEKDQGATPDSQSAGTTCKDPNQTTSSNG